MLWWMTFGVVKDGLEDMETNPPHCQTPFDDGKRAAYLLSVSERQHGHTVIEVVADLRSVWLH